MECRQERTEWHWSKHCETYSNYKVGHQRLTCNQRLTTPIMIPAEKSQSALQRMHRDPGWSAAWAREVASDVLAPLMQVLDLQRQYVMDTHIISKEALQSMMKCFDHPEVGCLWFRRVVNHRHVLLSVMVRGVARLHSGSCSCLC